MVRLYYVYECYLDDLYVELIDALYPAMMPRPPTSTLFPYTTLFRSSSRRTSAGAAWVSITRWVTAENKTPSRGRTRAVLRADRKSTRLNSSHITISYAVFCLKKKKTYQVS